VFSHSTRVCGVAGGFPLPPHLPAVQASSTVQPLPSLQLVPSVAADQSEGCAGSQTSHDSVDRRAPSEKQLPPMKHAPGLMSQLCVASLQLRQAELHGLLPPTHVPALQRSVSVQYKPSLQAEPSTTACGSHCPFVGLHAII